MCQSSRNYHSVDHVFDIIEGWDDAIGILAAYFHDCIYYTVDGGLSPIQAEVLGNILIESPNDGICLLNDPTDELLQLTLTIFGIDIEQEIRMGLNEFLSALVALRELYAVLDLPDLAKIACCIEATIPFRPDSEDGKTTMDQLFDRLQKANSDFNLGCSESELVESVQRAALLANRDVGNFGSEDREYFLDNTWSLLPETNKSLRQNHCYTVNEFQLALFKMCGFFSFVKPNVIFSSFRGIPSIEELNRLQFQAKRNLEIGKAYVGAKTLSVSLLAAFATLTGGDAPISLFMGDLPSRHHISRRLEDYLPQEEPPSDETCDPEIYRILLYGRKSEAAFDIRQSPLAAYLYACLGDSGIEKCLTELRLQLMTPQTARSLLFDYLPRSAVIRVGRNMAKIAVSREQLILPLVEELEKTNPGEFAVN
jgi:hypothetical protein